MGSNPRPGYESYLYLPAVVWVVHMEKEALYPLTTLCAMVRKNYAYLGRQDIWQSRKQEQGKTATTNKEFW